MYRTNIFSHATNFQAEQRKSENQKNESFVGLTPGLTLSTSRLLLNEHQLYDSTLISRFCRRGCAFPYHLLHKYKNHEHLEPLKVPVGHDFKQTGPRKYIFRANILTISLSNNQKGQYKRLCRAGFGPRAVLCLPLAKSQSYQIGHFQNLIANLKSV